jgi:ATP-dependent DNA helicase RecQ
MERGSRETPLEILRQYWGYDRFRSGQEEIIQSVLEGHDTLAIMPTGGGKSICYQVPAIARGGLCLVISPLVALMKDQVEGLRKKNITAYTIHSGLERKEVINIFKVASSSNCRFLFVSPERLESTLFREWLPALGITLIAVDEAHCISQWGYDFRPPYLRIAALRDELPGVSVLALTASATPDVQQDICARLRFEPGHVFRLSFERPKLSYSVFEAAARLPRIKEILRKVPGTAIVYCKSRRRTKEIADLLILQGISAAFYHAGLPAEERNARQDAWIRNEVRVMVCTNAFGMGIDKPDVRLVIHADPPDSLENYYQEAGRAGRDQKIAYAVLLYDGQDLPDPDLLVAEKFPPIEEVRAVYQAACNFLQVPAGEAEELSYNFDLQEFIQTFRLPGQQVTAALKMLEQEEYIAFNEQVFRPSRLQFICDKEHLFALEKATPALDELVKSMLRTYEGIFDQPTFISEKLLGGLVKKPDTEVTKQLAMLHAMGLVRYEPRKEKPQLVFLRPRQRAEELRFNVALIETRKKKYRDRVEMMRRYMLELHDCRSRRIASYFGDHAVRPCGICDNCLRQKSTELSPEEFDQVHQRILHLVRDARLSPVELIDQLQGIRKEKAWKVIHFLQAENKLSVNRNGKLILP